LALLRLRSVILLIYFLWVNIHIRKDRDYCLEFLPLCSNLNSESPHHKIFNLGWVIRREVECELPSLRILAVIRTPVFYLQVSYLTSDVCHIKVYNNIETRASYRVLNLHVPFNGIF
jgi:hypothetical protein